MNGEPKPSRFSAEEKRREAMREVGMLRRVYPTKAMSHQEAQEKIAIMLEIAEDYDKLAQEERLI